MPNPELFPILEQSESMALRGIESFRGWNQRQVLSCFEIYGRSGRDRWVPLCGGPTDYASCRSQRSAMIWSYGVFARNSMDEGSLPRDNTTRAPISSFSRQLVPIVLLKP
jgi:hypothetical protein